jgi:hypothetical protein
MTEEIAIADRGRGRDNRESDIGHLPDYHQTIFTEGPLFGKDPTLETISRFRVRADSFRRRTIPSAVKSGERRKLACY